MNTEAKTRAGFIAIIGAPNAGKSTLVNRLVGTKVSIVTHKVQTTRARVRGVAMVGQSQLVFVDTPGIFVAKRKLDEAMVSAAWEGAEEADIIALLVDVKAYLNRADGGPAARAAEDTDAIIARLAKTPSPRLRGEGRVRRIVLVLNKVDLVNPVRLLPLTKELNDRFAFDATFMISAETGDGVDDFAKYCAEHVPEGPWLYPEDQAADIEMRQLAAEIVREKLMLRLHDELPYASTVETEKWEQRRDGSARIEMTIYVEKASQKPIVLGKGGKTIREIGQAARAEIAKLTGAPVHLFLFVKVREHWAEDLERLRAMGLEPRKKG
jgi:GTP-binding protein Era